MVDLIRFWQSVDFTDDLCCDRVNEINKLQYL